MDCNVILRFLYCELYPKNIALTHCVLIFRFSPRNQFSIHFHQFSVLSPCPDEYLRGIGIPQSTVSVLRELCWAAAALAGREMMLFAHVSHEENPPDCRSSAAAASFCQCGSSFPLAFVRYGRICSAGPHFFRRHLFDLG